MDPAITNDTRPTGIVLLPQELVDTIFDYLRSEKATLKSCTLVSKSFLPTSQCHLFSTFKISKSNYRKFVELCTPTPPESTSDDQREREALRARVVELVNNHTTDLTFFDSLNHWNFDLAHPNFPKFPHLRRIVFKGREQTFYVSPVQKWYLHFTGLRSVEFDFDWINNPREILTTLCNLPETVDSISLIAASGYSFISSPPYEVVEVRNDPPTARNLNGTLSLNLSPYQSHACLFSSILRNGELGAFKFNLKRINYRLTCYTYVRPLALLVKECKSTLQFLDITVCSDTKCA